MLKAFRLLLFSAFVAGCTLLVAAQNATSTAPAAQPPKPTLAPSPSLAKDSRCFEIRTYYAAPGKLEDLHARFRDHTIELFKKHGMTNLFYFHPLDANKGAGLTLTYFLAHKSRDAATASWAAFRADPVWVKAKEMVARMAAPPPDSDCQATSASESLSTLSRRV